MRTLISSVVASLCVLSALRAQPRDNAADVTLMKAALGGSCSADFIVKDAAGKPIVDATVHVKIRYGFAGAKRADLEVGTSLQGKVRIEGLPDKARPMTYDVTKDELKTTVTQDVSSTCHATFDVTLK